MPKLGDIPGQVPEATRTVVVKRKPHDVIDFFEPLYKDKRISESSLASMLSVNNRRSIIFDSCDFSEANIVAAFRVGVKSSLSRPSEITFKDCGISQAAQHALSICLVSEYGINIKVIDTSLLTVERMSRLEHEDTHCKPTWFLELRTEAALLRGQNDHSLCRRSSSNSVEYNIGTVVGYDEGDDSRWKGGRTGLPLKIS